MKVSDAVFTRALALRATFLSANSDRVSLGTMMYVLAGHELEVWMEAEPVNALLGYVERVEQLPDGAVRLIGEPWESNRPQLVLQECHDGGE